MCLRIGSICSSLVSLVLESGIVYILSGGIIQWHRVFLLQRKVLKVHVLLRWLSWLVGIYGNRETIRFLSIRDTPLKNGKMALCWISPC
jgi:hypothetical protein